METKKEQKKVELSPEQIRTNFTKLTEGIKEIQEVMKILDVPEEVLDRDIKPFGNASHIILPEKYKGKKAKVIIKK